MITTFAGLLLSIAQPSAGNADLDCILNRLPPPARQRIVRETEQRGGDLTEAALSPLASAVESCSRERQWDEAFSQSVTQLSMAVVLGEAAGERLERAGIPTERIDRWFKAQSQAVRTNINMPAADTERLVNALVQSGIPLERVEANGLQIGVYLGALILIERVGEGLPVG